MAPRQLARSVDPMTRQQIFWDGGWRGFGHEESHVGARGSARLHGCVCICIILMRCSVGGEEAATS
eukprot:scaffold171659_cov33-Tisochrysis_lutea.AAC.3